MKKLLLAFKACFALAATYAQHQPSSPAIDSLKSERDPAVLQKKLDKLSKGNEQDLNLLIGYYYNVGSQAKADSIIQATVKKYPKGPTAYQQYENKLYTTHGGKNQEELFLANKGKFGNRDLDTQYFSVGVAYAIDRDLVKMNEYRGKIKNPYLQSVFARVSASAVMKYDSKAAEQIAKPEAEALYKKGMPDAAPNSSGYPDEKTRHYLQFMEVYATILTNNEQYEEAYKYAKAAYDANANKSDELKGGYAFLLYKTGRYNETFPLLYELVSTGKGNDELKQALKETYIKLNPGKDVGAYMVQVDNVLKAKIKEELTKTQLNEDAPNFVVTDVNGNTVTLADLKGKTIVLDFWATWCGPCKASFPAMQRVVNEYRNNPNVKILFVHTWENNKEPLKAAQNYLNTNNYKFDLYMDLKDPETNTNPAVTAFGVKGIPAKFVIDGNGKIRFKKVGFDGADDAAVAELSAMIDMVSSKK
jgi:thiol-disulfide isomerase/thioredoxin